MNNEEFDPSAARPNPELKPFAKSERVLGSFIHVYKLWQRDEVPMSWREEGTTVVFVDDDFGALGIPEAPPEGWFGELPPPPEGGWFGMPVPPPPGGWYGQPDPINPGAQLPVPDERPEELPMPDPDLRELPPAIPEPDADTRERRPVPPGQHYRLQNGTGNDCWVPFGNGGEMPYSNPSTGVTVGGCPAGTEFINAPHNDVFDKIFSTPFATGMHIDLSGPGVLPHGGQYIFEKGTRVPVTVSGGVTVQAGEITARRVGANTGPLGTPGSNAFVVGDSYVDVALANENPANLSTGRTRQTTYTAAADFTRTTNGSTGTVSAAPRTLTPYGPSYFGVVNVPQPSQATMKTFGKNIWGPAGRNLTFQSTNQRAAFAEPVAIGGISKITDETGADIYYDSSKPDSVNAFARFQVVFQLADGSNEPYYIFVKKSVYGNGTDFKFIIVR